MVSYLSPKQVRQLASALSGLNEQELRARYNPTAFRARDIYPGGAFWDAHGVEPLIEALHRMRNYFTFAARDGDVVLDAWV